MKAVGATLEKTSLKVSGLECNGLDFEGQFYFSLALVPGVLGLIVVVAGAVWGWTILRSRSAQTQPLATLALKMCLATGYFFVYPVAAKSLSMFACIPEPIPDPQASYLASAPWIECGKRTHSHLAATSGSVLAVLALISTAIGYAVFRWRHDHHSVVGSAVGFLHESYRSHVWWFEGAVLLRRVAIAAFVSILPRGSVFVTPLLLTVLLGGVILVYQKRPYASAAAQRLEIATLIGSSISLVIVQNMSLTGESTSLALASALFIGLNGAVVITAGIYLVAPLISLAGSLTSTRRTSFAVQ